MLLLAGFGVGFERPGQLGARGASCRGTGATSKLTQLTGTFMASDPRLTAAISHWGARFVANGVALTDFEDVTRSLTSYDEWCARLVGARRACTSRWAARRWRRGKHPHRRRMSAARRRLLSLRLVPVRARSGADEGRAQEGGRVPAGGAAVPAAARRARRNPLSGQNARRHPAQAGRRGEARRSW